MIPNTISSKIAFRLLIIVCVFLSSSVKSANEDLEMSYREKQALDQLKTRKVFQMLTQSYMKEDIWIINWVRVSDLNVDKAEQMLREHLKWRKENKIDEIINEDFQNLSENFPVDIGGVDYNGIPFIVVHFGEWNVRQAHLTGYKEKIYRYTVQGLEKTSKLVRDAQKKGQEVTRFHVILDMDGFNMAIHYCLQCASTYYEFFSTFRNHFPAMIDNLIFVNSPASFQVLQSFGASSKWHKKFKMFGNDKREWKEYLLSFIPPEQLEKSLGGTKVAHGIL